MTRLEQLKKKVNDLYLAKNESRANWADWLYANHVFVVADYAGELADRFGADKEFAMAAGILHDIAILFSEAKEEMRPDYEKLKTFFSGEF